MIKIDANLLDELGLKGLSDDEKNDAIEEIMNTLKDRVGDRAIDILDDNQVKQLEHEMLHGSFESTQKYLQENVPDYEGMVDAEFKKIMSDVKFDGLAALNYQEKTTKK